MYITDNWYYPLVRYCSYIYSIKLLEKSCWLSIHTCSMQFEDFENAIVYLLSYRTNPSPPTSSPDTLPTTLCPLWCTYQHISPLIFFTWTWTVLWCLTDNAWARSPVFGEGTVFLLHVTYLWASDLPWKEVFQRWGGQLCLYGKCLCEPVLPTHQADQMRCGHFHPAQSPNKCILPPHRVYLCRGEATLCNLVAFGLLGVLAEQVIVGLQYVL